MSGLRDGRKVVLLIVDLALFYSSLFAILIIRYSGVEVNLLVPQHMVPFSILFLAWIAVFYLNGLYELRYARNDTEFIRRLIRAMVINASLAVGVFYFIPFFGITPRLNLFAVLTISAIAISIWRQIAQLLFRRITKESVLFLGITDEVAGFAEYLSENPQFGYRVAGLMRTDESLIKRDTPNLPMRPFSRDLGGYVRREGISLIVTSPTATEHAELSRSLVELLPSGISITPFTKFYSDLTSRVPISIITDRWLLENPVASQRIIFDQFKRLLDIIASIVFLVPTILLTPIVGLLIKLETKGPIFYQQARVGKNGRLFSISKFRSMITNAEKGGVQWSDENDPRITRVGKFLRGTRIDELPQIISVLQGHLSFVGPRPERPEFVQQLRTIIPFYDIRHIVKPGLTGWAQINLSYGPSVNNAYEKLQYELFYIKNRSMALDLAILFKTITTVLSRAGR